ncbi:MAG: TetR/AcrR family transcriptional regulator [Pseudomonadota bacterium]
MRIDGKRQRILNAAQEIISEKGLKDTTIFDIASKADVVDSIIYYYFKNKEDLLFCAIDSQMKSATAELLCHLKGVLGPVSKLGKMVWCHLHANDFSQGDERIRKHLLLECRANKSFYQHESYKSLRKYAAVLLDILKEGVAEGNFRGDLNLAVVRDFIFGLLDEESLSCLAAREITETTPDFNPIMSLILSMIENQPENGGRVKKVDKAQTVLKAATALFARKGFNKSTMLEIANEAAVSEGTIYEYYVNKQNLLLCISKEQFATYKADLDVTYNVDDPRVKLKRLIWNHFFLFTSNSDFLAIFLNDIKLNKHFYATDSYKYFIHYYGKVSEIIEEGKRAGVFRQDVHDRVYRNLLIGSFTHLMLRWFFISTPTPLVFMKEFHHATELLCRAVMDHGKDSVWTLF